MMAAQNSEEDARQWVHLPTINSVKYDLSPITKTQRSTFPGEEIISNAGPPNIVEVNVDLFSGFNTTAITGYLTRLEKLQNSGPFLRAHSNDMHSQCVVMDRYGLCLEDILQRPDANTFLFKWHPKMQHYTFEDNFCKMLREIISGLHTLKLNGMDCPSLTTRSNVFLVDDVVAIKPKLLDLFPGDLSKEVWEPLGISFMRDIESALSYHPALMLQREKLNQIVHVNEKARTEIRQVGQFDFQERVCGGVGIKWVTIVTQHQLGAVIIYKHDDSLAELVCAIRNARVHLDENARKNGWHGMDESVLERRLEAAFPYLMAFLFHTVPSNIWMMKA